MKLLSVFCFVLAIFLLFIELSAVLLYLECENLTSNAPKVSASASLGLTAMVILRSIKDVDDWNYDETAGEEDTKHEDWIRQFIVKWITTLFDLPEEDNGDKKKRLFSSYREELDIVTRNQISYQRMILMMTFRSITKRITMDGMTMMMISRLAISKRVILKITMTTMAMVSI